MGGWGQGEKKWNLKYLQEERRTLELVSQAHRKEIWGLGQPLGKCLEPVRCVKGQGSCSLLCSDAKHKEWSIVGAQ